MCDIKRSDVIFEIGAGRGELTKHLLDKANKVFACEKDDLLIPFLKQYNVEIVHKDFMKVTIPGSVTKIVGNIPYYLSSEITEKILKTNLPCFILYQEEFAERLVAKPGSDNYSRLSVLAQYLSNPEILFNVNRHNFKPMPRVDSAFVRFIPKENKYDEDFFYFIRLAFQHKNKKLRNSLIDSRFGGRSKKELKKLLNIVSDKKVRFLSVKELKSEYKKVKNLVNNDY